MELSIEPLLDYKYREHGYALVDPITADRIGVKGGDCVRISARDASTVSRIELDDGETEARGVIGVNVDLISQLQVTPDESVAVEKANSSLAERVHVVDLQDRGFQGQFDSVIRERLKGHCVIEGQEMRFSVAQTSGGSHHEVPVRIMDTDPSSVASISEDSEVRITNPPAEFEGGNIVSVNNDLMEILDGFVEQSSYNSKTEFINEVLRDRLEDEDLL